MATETIPAPQKPRLNPFAFPSDTDFRFVLLIVTVLGASIFYFMVWLRRDVPFISQRWLNGVTACGHQVFGQGFDQFLNQVVDSGIDPKTDAEKALFDQYFACTFKFEFEFSLWVLGGVALLIGVAIILFWVYPVWKIRRDRLLPLTAEDAPEVIEFLSGLCREVKLKQSPTFLWNPLNTTSSGLAFGRLGKYYVALSGGLVTQFYTDPSAFRAILLHELSHLKNADVDKTYFATAIWQAFLLIAVIPFVVLDFSLFGIDSFIGIFILTALVYLVRNSVLRSREFYADARADIWDRQNALESVLATLPHQQSSMWQSLKVHPSPSDRRLMLVNSYGLFQSSFWIAVATGMAFSIMNGPIQLLYGQFDVPLSVQSIVSALFFSILVVGILGMGVWRASFARSILGNLSVGKGRLALGVTLGILFYDFQGNLDSTTTFYWVFIELFWGGLLFLVLYALFHWIASTAETWLEVAAASRSPRRVYILNLSAAIAISSVAFAWLLTNHWFIETTSLTDLLQTAALLYIFFAALYVGVINPFVLMALASLWAVPMAAWFWRKQAMPVKMASWAYLEHSPSESHSTPLGQFWQFGFSVLTGIALGILYCGVLLALRILVRVSGLGAVINGNDSYEVAFFNAWFVLAVLMQIGAAVVVSGKVKRLGWAHGLFAAFIGGCVMAVGILAINSLFRIMDGKTVSLAVGGGLEPYLIWRVFSQVINLGTFFALIPAIAMSAIAGRMRRNRI